jgi:hypothetical protein
MKDELLQAMKDRLHLARSRLHDGARGSCTVDDCPHDAIAKGFCNAHYLRFKRGARLSDPVRALGNKGLCIECGDTVNGKGGWMRCARHFKMARQQTIKDALIDAMGGSCQRCNGVFPSAAFDFHHVGDKDNNPSALISNASVERIAAEIERCVLLCANCHRIEHAREL